MKGKKTLVVLLLFVVVALQMPAQSRSAPAKPETTNTPQWAKDIRRFEIVLFGSIPFAMFIATFAVDMVRWNDFNGMSFDDMTRAPWPLKSAGAVPMEDKDVETTLIIAASLSMAVAVADQIIVQIKRHKARKKAEALPVGTTIIVRKPWPENQEEQDPAHQEAGVPGAGETEQKEQEP